jgi:hypothetical protein
MDRIRIFDEENKPSNDKMKAFDNLGVMIDFIMTEYRKRTLKRVQTEKKRLRNVK